MCFFLLRRVGSLQCLFFWGEFWTLEKSGEEVRVTGHQMFFFFFSVETLLEAPLVVLWLGGKKKKLDGVFFSKKTCGGTSNTYLVSPSKKITRVSLFWRYFLFGNGRNHQVDFRGRWEDVRLIDC